MNRLGRTEWVLRVAALSGALACSDCKREPHSDVAEASAPVASSSAPEPSAPVASPSVAEAGPPPSLVRTVGGASVRLLDSGQPPRRKLRYAWRVEQGETLSMDLRTAASTESAGTKQAEVTFPSVHLSIALDPQSVTPDGDLHYA